MDLVNILVSIYNPDMNFLEKQLRSLDEQDYKNIKVIIWDDNPKSNFDSTILKNIFRRHSYSYEKAEKNLGYAKAFEHLIMQADGTYVAFCDQDDIWMSNKISHCIAAMKKEKAVLITSDRAIIDENDKVVMQSVRREQPDISNSWNTGDNITVTAVFNTCAIGMNIVMRTDVAKTLLPIPKDTAHDKWLTAGASVKGKLVFLDEVLVQYRRHGKNVSGVLHGISSKRDYYDRRVKYSDFLAQEFLARFPGISKTDKQLIQEFSKARLKKNVLKIYKYRDISPNIAKFEMLLAFLPAILFRMTLSIVKKRTKL